MAEQNTQPTCGYLGATVRADRITAVDRSLTPRLAEVEQHTAAMACDPVLAAQSLFDADPIPLNVEAQPISEMLGEALNTPGLMVYVNGRELERQFWRMITPREGTRIDVVVPVHGGGGGGGGKKNTLAIVATLVVAAGAIAISGGALGPAGLGIAGLGGGTLGAAAASSAFGLPDSLAVASLRPRKLRR